MKSKKFEILAKQSEFTLGGSLLYDRFGIIKFFGLSVVGEHGSVLKFLPKIGTPRSSAYN